MSGSEHSSPPSNENDELVNLLKRNNEDGLISSWIPGATSSNTHLLAPSLSEPAPRSPRSPGRRKISESRGFSLPKLDLHPQQTKPSVNFGDEIVESPPPTCSPVGHYLKPPFGRSPKWTEKLKAVLDICIFLPDQRGIQFKVEGGRLATAEQLELLLWNHFSMQPALATEMFALWMCSPLLEVQLKPHHNPLEVRKYWPDLLRRFTVASEEEREMDEPLLMVKRNVLLSKERQFELIGKVGDKAYDLLFLEARECVLNGRYLCPLDMCIQLAAIQMVMDYGPHHADYHNAEFVRQRLEEFLPTAYLSSAKSLSIFGWIMPGCTGMENEFLSTYQDMSGKPITKLRKLYINLCMKLPTYGSAIFTGQIERPSAVPLKDIPVKIMISREYLCIVDPAKFVCLLTVSLHDCSCRRLDSKIAQCLSSFFVHFPDPSSYANQPENDPSSSASRDRNDNDAEPVSKLVQIFTKQAVMMDALVNSCIQAWRLDDDKDEAEELQARFFADREDEENLHNLELETSKMAKEHQLYQTKLNRLCFATFDCDGVCLDAVGSLKMIVDVGR